MEAHAKLLSNMASQINLLESDAPPQPGLAYVMAAIATCQSTMNPKIEAVQSDVGLLRQDIEKLCSRVSAAEHRVGQAEDMLSEHTTAICNLQTNLCALIYKAEDAESHNRRNNFRILGLDLISENHSIMLKRLCGLVVTATVSCSLLSCGSRLGRLFAYSPLHVRLPYRFNCCHLTGDRELPYHDHHSTVSIEPLPFVLLD